MRITIAGFGGALAGISISRRSGGVGGLAKSAQVMAKKATAPNKNVIPQTRTQRRQAIRSAPPVLRPSIDRELPSAWAVACMAFAGVVEFTRLVSPTTFVSQFINAPPLKIESDDDPSTIDPLKYGSTIIDYMIGGAIAGAIFKGSAVRTPAGARLDASIMGNYSASSVSTAIKGKPLSGILPGAALGLLAGVSIVSLEYANMVIEEKFGVEDDNNTDDNIAELVAPKQINDDIPADIKAMTSEELAASIQNLRSGIVESHEEEQRVEGKAQEQEEQSNTTEDKATDLLYSIGFRPHQS